VTLLQVRAAAIAALGLLSVGTVLPAADVPSGKPTPAVAASAKPTLPSWAQTRSDIAPDPAVRFGTLPNGMRYALMHNVTPNRQVALRLRIGSGSLEEQTSQQGLAHFLEHMAFRGSKSVADGEVKKSLERLGLQMGADTNAFTAQSQTVYKFDLASNDDESIDHGLLLLRETGDALTLDPKLFDVERGVVESELRLSDVPAQHMYDALAAFTLPNQLASERMPIGKKAVLDAATVNLLRDYYRKWYRPERATLVVAGDIDVDAMEGKIRARFADWKSPGPAVHDPDFGKPVPRKPEARVFTEEGAPAQAQLLWVTPFDASVESVARDRHAWIRELGFAAINRRLQVAAAAADRKFLSAGVLHQAPPYAAEVNALVVAYEADEWRPAVLAAEALRRQAVEGGIQQEELDREIDSRRTQLKAQVAGAATRTTPRLADALVGSVDQDQVFTSPEQDLAQFEGFVKDLTAASVNEVLRAQFTNGGGPLAFVSNPNEIADGDERALAALNEAERGGVVAAAALKKEIWPYTNFGTLGTVADKKKFEDVDLTEVRFANGVRLNIKPTKLRADQVLVAVQLNGGRASMPTDKPALDWAYGSLVLGGTGKLDYQSMSRVLAGKTYRVNFALNDNALSFTGETTTQDLTTQLQVLAAYVTDPALRPEAFEQLRGLVQRQLTQVQSNPQGVFSLNLPNLLHSGDGRWAPPTAARVAAAQLDELKAQLLPALAQGSIELTVVGDVTVDQVIDTVAATFGAIPPRSEFPPRAVEGVRFPAATATPVTVTHHGPVEQGVTAIAWPTTDVFSNTREVAVRNLLADIMTSRLFDSVRAAEGAAYSPSAFGSSSVAFKNYGYLMALADVPPAKSQTFYDAVSKIEQDLKTNPVSDDELNRARTPALAKLAQAQQTNGYWIGSLDRVQSDPRFLDLERHRTDNLKAVTAADLQQAAVTYLVDDKAFRLIVQSGGGPAGPPVPPPRLTVYCVSTFTMLVLSSLK
jgi:zinc protease